MYVGIDLYTNRFTCCYLFDEQSKKQAETFNLDKEGLKDFYSTIGFSIILQFTNIFVSIFLKIYFSENMI